MDRVFPNPLDDEPVIPSEANRMLSSAVPPQWMQPQSTEPVELVELTGGANKRQTLDVLTANRSAEESSG